MPLDISIVIVNYNVQYFIEQCLNSIFDVSDFTGTFEVIVVDNNSSDSSVSLIKKNFPEVILIENTNNVGFSVANNQGINISSGKYILLLNPDTLVSEDTLSTCYNEMESDIKIGALGAKMVDGSGNFLPESKRGFPSPTTSFYRFSGLFKLFPKSPKINAYYQGHVSEDQRAEVEILCGAFMFLRKSVLDEIGLLDEAFFMYGEDIDLSFRITQAGYKIIYCPQTTIVHFKGESTKKDAVAYTQRFYKAMDIFANKHYQGSQASKFLKYLSVVIWAKAVSNYFSRTAKKVLLPLLDITAIYTGLFLISELWARFYFEDENYYNSATLKFNFTMYTLIWFISVFYGGGYDRRISLLKLLRNILLGSLVIFALYGLLAVEFRSSRAIIIIASAFVSLILPFFRFILGQWGRVELQSFSRRKRIIVLADEREFSEIKKVLESTNLNLQFIQHFPVDISQYELQELIDLRKIDEIICHVKDVGMRRIIELMSSLGSRVSFKITGDESLGIIGSQSKNTNGEIYTFEINYRIQQENSLRNKRTIDLVVTILSLIGFPILILFPKFKKILRNSWSIIKGKKTIIGYSSSALLPNLKESIFKIPKGSESDYAKNYSVWKELKYLYSTSTK